MTPARSTPLPVVFLAIASSEVGRYRALKELEQEYKELQALHKAAARAGRCELVSRFAVTLDEIFGVFQSLAYGGRIAVFHFAGHAEEDLLVMENAAGEVLLAGAGGLAQFLSAQASLQLCFINGCRTEAQITSLHGAASPPSSPPARRFPTSRRASLPPIYIAG